MDSIIIIFDDNDEKYSQLRKLKLKKDCTWKELFCSILEK